MTFYFRNKIWAGHNHCILFAAASASIGVPAAIVAAALLSADLLAATAAVLRKIVVSVSDLNHRAPPKPTIIAVLSSDSRKVGTGETTKPPLTVEFCVASHAPTAATMPTNTTPISP